MAATAIPEHWTYAERMEADRLFQQVECGTH
jgi:hypothetical protein